MLRRGLGTILELYVLKTLSCIHMAEFLNNGRNNNIDSSGKLPQAGGNFFSKDLKTRNSNLNNAAAKETNIN